MKFEVSDEISVSVCLVVMSYDDSDASDVMCSVQDVSVWCDMETLAGGWTVLQRRGDFGQDKNYFLKGWELYKNGFGNPEQVREREIENYTKLETFHFRITG